VRGSFGQRGARGCDHAVDARLFGGRKRRPDRFAQRGGESGQVLRPLGLCLGVLPLQAVNLTASLLLVCGVAAHE
jgi:hypothetical protein